jgi:phosphoribosylaminoimidazolecarboxamide formyltransferase / IMP cyclohydrolase
MKRIARALLSVSDKTGVEEFATGLTALGVEIVSTGGTARVLRARGLTVRDVSEVTGFPEMLDGRVKTLHPKVHGGLLGVRSNPQHLCQMKEHGIEPIDMVVVNLYPFERTAARPEVSLAEIIENIDIGGPAMIRSAAKNFADVAVLVDSADYPPVLEEMRLSGGSVSEATRAQLARKAFATTAAYDGAISTTLQRWAASTAETGAVGPPGSSLPERLHPNFRKLADLRYGENPHQRAALYEDPTAGGRGLAHARQLQGKELSYNNLVDLEAAWRLAQEFDEPATAIIKHTNPCGVATAGTLRESYLEALAVDPISAFGSVIAFNRAVDAATAEELVKLFVEAAVAPQFEKAAVEKLSAKKNLRVMEMPAAGDDYGLQLKSVGGGLLAQTPDTVTTGPGAWKCVTQRCPSETELTALAFAWRVAKHVKSNAIVFAHENVAIGVGAGQMSRVDAVRLAVSKARELHHKLKATVVGSDAFFPFPDGVEEAAHAGATAIVQPGGSVRDAEVIGAADRLGLAMMFTGMRHFRH